MAAVLVSNNIESEDETIGGSGATVPRKPRPCELLARQQNPRATVKRAPLEQIERRTGKVVATWATIRSAERSLGVPEYQLRDKLRTASRRGDTVVEGFEGYNWRRPRSRRPRQRARQPKSTRTRTRGG